MRITSRISADNAVYNINLGRQRMERLNEMITSGMQVSSPSQDPVATKKILDLEGQVKTSDQYISNIKNGSLWLDMVANTVEGVLDSVMEVKSIASQGVTGLGDPIKQQELMTSLKLYRDQLLDMPNSSAIGDQYVMSGYKSNLKPFPTTAISADTTLGSSALTNIDTTNITVGMPISGPGIPDGAIVTAITSAGAAGAVTLSSAATATAAGASLSYKGTFAGTDDPLNVEINKGLTLNVNVTGGSLLRGGTPPGSSGVDIIKTIDNLMADIQSGNQAGVVSAVATIDTASKQVLSVISDIGMRKARLDNALQSQQRLSNVLKTSVSNIQDVDLAKAATELTQQKTAYEAALSATAKITPLSLLDYLK